MTQFFGRTPTFEEQNIDENYTRSYLVLLSPRTILFELH